MEAKNAGAAVTGASGTGATAAKDQGPRLEPVRVDQVACPLCRHMGCPAEGGTRRFNGGTVRYRVCGNTKCGHTFKTQELDVARGKESIVG